MSTLPYYQNQGSPQSMIAAPLPVQVSVAGPARQRRLTVLLRLLMTIPHYIVLYFLSVAAGVVLFLGWWAALFTGRLPGFAATYLTGYMRWSARVYAYLMLLTDSYPPFSFEDDPAYPVHIAVAQERLNRLAVLFRIILVIPANLLSALIVVGGMVVSFIGWLITLITGQLPTSLHLAYSAVLRFVTRTYCYYYLLTPTYPGGLFGDRSPAAGTMGVAPPGPADYAPPSGGGFGAPGYGAPGYGAPQSGYDAPGYGTAQPGYGAAGYDTPRYGTPQPGYDAPGYGGAGYDMPQPGYGTPGYGTAGSVYGPPGGAGYGAPGGSAAGYGTPGGYGVPQAAGAPVAPPVDWRLFLTSGAKRLIVLFIVVGALAYVGYVGLIAVAVGSGSNALQANYSLSQVDTAYTTLTGELTTWDGTVKACDQNLTCVTAADGKAATYFSSFASTLQGTSMPSSASAAANSLYSDATQAAQDFSELSQTTSVAQYQSTYASTNLEQVLDKFGQDYDTLNTALESYS